MPCRALSICRQATGPSQCLWITDDVLADAWNRFARVSNAAGKRRCEGRRYGSNVPGPLEAVRRLSKRRMGVAAVVAGGPPMGADFGALFGIGSFKPEQRTDGWKWEAPQLDRRKTKETKTDAGWFGSGKTRKEDAWDSFLQPPALEEDAQDANHAARTEEQAIEQSRDEFNALLGERAHLERVEKGHWVEILDFLQSAADEPKANNLMSLLRWLKMRDVSDEVVSAIALLVKEKVELETCGDNLAGILAALLQQVDAKSSCHDIAKVLRSVTQEDFGDVCIETTREIFRVTAATSGAHTQGPAQAVKVWLDCLETCEQLNVWHCDSLVWQNIYAIIAQHIQKPSILARHFSTLHRLDLSRILLRHWAGIPKFHHSSGSGEDEAMISIVGLNKNLNFRQSLNDVDMDAVLRDFDAARATQYGRRKERLRTSSPLVDMLDVARRHGLQYERLCEELFDILMHCSSATSVQRVSWELRCHKDLGLTLRTAQRLVHYFLRHDKIKFAYSLFRAVPTLSLLHVHELPIKLAYAGTVGSSEMWQVLQRQIKHDFVEFHDRESQSPELTLTPEHIDLMHLVAHAFANSPALAPRVAFRRVWQCYLFLRDRRAPINSLLTRALVHAGVTRRLKALKRPSTEQFRYIMSLVARIEGIETAEKLDRAVYRYWTERVQPHLIRFSRSIDSALGISEDAAVEKRTAWYNLRKLSREHRPWLLSGRPGRSETPNLISARKTTPNSSSTSGLSNTWPSGGPEISASSSVELPTSSNHAAVSAEYVPYALAETTPARPQLTRTPAASTGKDIKSVEPQPISSQASRRGLGYNAPQNIVCATGIPEHDVKLEVPPVNTDPTLRSSFDAGIAPADPTIITDVTLQQATSLSLVYAESADPRAWLDAEDAEQFDGEEMLPASGAKTLGRTSGLMQKRLSLYSRKHDVSKSFPQNNMTAQAAQRGDQEDTEEGPEWKLSSAPLETALSSLAEAYDAPSAATYLPKLKPLGAREKRSLELQGICVRCRRPGHQAGDVRCPANKWTPSTIRSTRSPQPEREDLEWQQAFNGDYNLFVKIKDEWWRYSRVKDRIRQIRRRAEKTGRAHSEHECKLLKKWEAAQEEMAKRQASLNRMSKSTVFPA